MTETARSHCLQTRLVWRLISLQAGLLAIIAILVIGTLWGAGLLLDARDEDRVIEIVQQAVAQDTSGGLLLRSRPELAQLREEIPDLWFVVRDSQGHSLSEGAVPPDFVGMVDALSHISQARLGWQLLADDLSKPAARLKRVDTAAGTVQILTATQGKPSGRKAMLMSSLSFLGVVLPGLLLMAAATFVATPMVVRRALAGLGTVADQARRIDIHQRGARLSVEHVADEIAPLVRAVNEALARLDDGYLRQQRFVADAAHELRTPIAILNTRLESLPAGAEKNRLLEDTARLSTLTEQLLDIQRLDQCGSPFTPVDVVAVAQGVAANLAPLAIAAGYELSLQVAADRIETLGDHGAIERAVTNLVQNAIQHGGCRGSISIHVSRPATIEVTDEGPGIPAEQRALIFEPFYRVTPLERGAGLGLNMVREIARMHGGHISVFDGPNGGACFRLTLPPAPSAK
ncbi:sensor histidine kinase KdpD [Bradyrhizobium sp. sGM-13]|uniref:sensor histidine kinase n=1 Tax=Bradyrhizobium sp. sGM-13 TaxID=2831781 RepID=UPI001BD16BC4|nr:HAMP domain-containing sensor histidine kinase [Bradyrhizobium sp. sGM-13]